MPVVKLPGGGTAIVCGRGLSRKRCVTCGKPSDVLCDYPVKRNGKEGTCDRPCCREHAVSVGDNRDYCLAHAEFDEEAGIVGNCIGWTPPLDWIIIGGESGPGARPFNIAWARSIISQCRAAGVACFVKQLGAWVLSPKNDGFLVNNYLLGDGRRFSPPIIGPYAGVRPQEAIGFSLFDKKGGDPEEWPLDLRVRQFPKEAQA